MNSDQLKTSNELTSVIQSLEAQLFVWENATELHAVNVISKKVPTSVDSSGLCRYDVNAGFIDFQVLKIMTIAFISKRLEEVRKEFASI